MSAQAGEIRPARQPNHYVAPGFPDGRRSIAMREAASFIASQITPAPAGLVTAFLRQVRLAARSLNSRRQLARLSEFDDHMLADIGLRRQDLSWALQLPFGADPTLELERRSRQNREGARGWRI
jgi:uncharacterized protein YjiS (DUF1127 family)